MTKFISRAYNTFEVDSKTNAVVVKQSKDSRLADEVEYFTNIPLNLSMYFPRVFYHEKNNDIIKVGMEYYAYNNLGNLMINESFDSDTWHKIFSFILKFFNNAGSYKHTLDGTNDCRLMYIDKTETEYFKLINNFSYFKLFEDTNSVYLNGTELKTFKVIWPKLKQYIEKTCLSKTLTFIHGDMCFSNILYGKNPINNDIVLKFIDPRGSFGNTKIYGDIYYDLAKIMHSCDGKYEYIITDNFELIDNNVNFKLNFHKQDSTDIKNVLDKIILQHKFNNTKILLLQGLIFIGMCARHYDSQIRQKAMFLTGLRILNNVYNNIVL
jgi:hypothetical protein